MCHLLPHRGEGNGLLKHGGQSDVHEMLKQVQHDMFNFLKRTYSLINLFTYSPRKRAAFTLAEVLITLGIIGVVAAMTIPTLIQDHREKQRVTQLKKVYSVLSQAFVMAQAEYGDIQTWDYATTNTGEKDENGEAILDESGSELFTDILKKYIKQSGKTSHTFSRYLSLDGRNYSSSGSSSLKNDYNKIYTADGAIIMIGWVNKDCGRTAAGCGDIEVFLPEKTAKVGVSAFWFYITPNGIKPYGHQGHDRSFEDYCDVTNSKGKPSTEQGRGCTAWVLYNENMDYLHCNDLSWSGKTKCK